MSEISILNDTGIGIGNSVGEILDTDSTVVADVEEEKVIADVDKQDGLKKKPKVHRPCMFCPADAKFQSALPRHIKTVHKEHPKVIKAMSLKRRERVKAFEEFKKEGIYIQNRREMAKEIPQYIRERKKEFDNNDDLYMCSNCKGCYSKGYKSRHQVYCGRNSAQVMIPMIPVDKLVINETSDAFKKVMSKMVLDDVSGVAKTDPIILIVGQRTYNGHKDKTEKLPDVEKRVRSTMRVLSRLYLEFKTSIGETENAGDMLKVQNLKHLRTAIEALGEDGDKIKNGLKVQIQNALKDSGKIMEAHYLVEGETEKAAAVTDFMKVFGVTQYELFNGALYQLKQKRNKTTRKPANLPEPEIVNELNNYLKSSTLKKNFEFQLPCTVFNEVRDATCARLTIFNGRRGGEPARMFIYQWEEALNGVWLRPETRDFYQSEVETGSRITFQEGKGNKQVPIFIPPDLVDAMSFLCSKDVRNQSDVAKSNTYVFPSRFSSDNHVSGWHSLMYCCKKAGLEKKVNGTMNRHRVSSLIGAMGLSEADQQLVFDHFGHSGDVNKNIYQVPQAERQLSTTGKYLEMIDTGIPFSAVRSTSDTRSSPPSLAVRPSRSFASSATITRPRPILKPIQGK